MANRYGTDGRATTTAMSGQSILRLPFGLVTIPWNPSKTWLYLRKA